MLRRPLRYTDNLEPGSLITTGRYSVPRKPRWHSTGTASPGAPPGRAEPRIEIHTVQRSTRHTEKEPGRPTVFSCFFSQPELRFLFTPALCWRLRHQLFSSLASYPVKVVQSLTGPDGKLCNPGARQPPSILNV